MNISVQISEWNFYFIFDCNFVYFGVNIQPLQMPLYSVNVYQYLNSSCRDEKQEYVGIFPRKGGGGGGRGVPYAQIFQVK